jgi:DNA-binding transcriptional regulator YiaG
MTPTDPIDERNGRLLVSWRKEHRLTDHDVATLANKDVQVVRDWEAGRAVMPRRILDLIKGGRP